MKKQYDVQEGFGNLDSARQSRIDSRDEHHSRVGKGEKKSRLCKVAASPNSHNLTKRRIKRAKLILKILEEHFPHPQIPLQHKDPYTLLIAVLLSARCTDARVNLITPKLFALADTPQKMVHLTPEQIQNIIRPCGLSPAKSRAIWQLSHDLINHHKGKVPSTLEELELFPGVGHKTASVVLAQAFHKPAFPVDTHIHRCAHRWKLGSGKNVTQTEKDLKHLFPKDKWIKVHLQIIHFARAYCPARGHNKEKCPICSQI